MRLLYIRHAYGYMLYCAQLPTGYKAKMQVGIYGGERGRIVRVRPPIFAKYFKKSHKLAKIYPKNLGGKPPPPFFRSVI